MAAARHDHGEDEKAGREQDHARIENQASLRHARPSPPPCNHYRHPTVLETRASMANNLVENLGKELEQIDREYASDFAGHSRLTRDIGQMERMIKRCASIVSQVDRIPAAAQGPDLTRVRDAAAASLALYQGEREAIARAQAV